MKSVLLICLLTLLPVGVYAQMGQIIRGNCTPHLLDDGVADTRAGQQPRRLPTINKQWDADREYRQLVILITFSDLNFKFEPAREVFDSIFNEPGYNKRNGAGCMADYFRCQSGGMFNLKFDVYGPYKLSSKAQPYDNPTKDTRNYGSDQMQEATNMFIAEHTDTDFSPYDWNGDGYINQVIYVCAGYSGNEGNPKCYGYVWPNTGSFSAITTPDGKKIANYTTSCELWRDGSSCGIGTICHEFTHSLGLPDIYPTSSNAPFSAVDEWDLMDGGNFTNYGWCPPNYSAMEKMLLGWLTPTELTEPVHIDAMKPVADGGEVYLVRNTTNEYYLLENRQQKDWDLGIPGHGLAIFHVNYDAGRWASNSVNITKGAYRYDLIHADNMDYDTWYDKLISESATSQYANKRHMNSWILSSSPYPCIMDSTQAVNAELTDTSVPAATVYNANADGTMLMSKPITNITQNPDGTIAFDFMGGEFEGIGRIENGRVKTGNEVYDIHGRRMESSMSKNGHGLLIVRTADGIIKKVIR